MKILQINSVCGVRSTGRICADLARMAQERGHDCKIAYGRLDAPNSCRPFAYKIGSNVNVSFHAAKALTLDASGFGSRHATKSFLRWIRSFDPDLIHLHNLHGFYLHLPTLFAYLKEVQKPVVWTLHDCWSFTGHCAYYDAIGCDKWKKAECISCPQKRAYPPSFGLSRSHKNYLAKKELFSGLEQLTLVCPSQWLSAQCADSFLSSYPIKVIPNGIDLTVFRPTPSNFAEKNGLVGKKIVLGVASVWEDRKGLCDFVQLAAMLPEEYKIVLVGVSDAQKRSLPPQISAFGRTDSTETLAQIYSAAHVFVNPTYEEVLGLTNLEARACGTPVITYRTGGSAECVTPQSGMVVPKGDVAALCDAICHLQLPAGRIEADDYALPLRYAEYMKLYESFET